MAGKYTIEFLENNNVRINTAEAIILSEVFERARNLYAGFASAKETFTTFSMDEKTAEELLQATLMDAQESMEKIEKEMRRQESETSGSIKELLKKIGEEFNMETGKE